MFKTFTNNDLSGGLNEVFPWSKIAPNQFSVFQNYDYVRKSPWPETRQGTAYLAAFTDFPQGMFTLNLSTSYGASSIMVVTTNNSPKTEFWGRPGYGAFTSRGTLAQTSAEWFGLTFNDQLVMFSPFVAAAKKWTGTGAVANLGGTPPVNLIGGCVWNSRIFAFKGTTVYYCALGDGEDWTNVDAVAGAGFFNLLTGGPITGIVGHKERLVITQVRRVTQVITANPNTDPGLWRVEEVTSAGGGLSKYAFKPLLNDLILYNGNFGACSFNAVQNYGDFELAAISGNVNVPLWSDGPASITVSCSLGTYYGIQIAVVQDKCILMDALNQSIWVFDMNSGQPRWRTWKFKRKIGGVESNALPVWIADDCYLDGGGEKLLYMFNNNGSGQFHLAYWPNNATNDDRYKDHLDSPDGTATFETIARGQAFDGGSLGQQKRVGGCGFSCRRKSTTVFNASQASFKFTYNIYFDEDVTKIMSFELTDTGTGIVDHHVWVHPYSSTEGRRFSTIAYEIKTNESGVGIQLKQFEQELVKVGHKHSSTIQAIGGS